MNSADPLRFKDEDDHDVLRGQYHGHPYGELNLVVPLNKEAELKGLQGWQGPGWTAPDPGSRHYPEVRGGAVIALFYLPAGRISYNFKAPARLRASTGGAMRRRHPSLELLRSAGQARSAELFLQRLRPLRHRQERRLYL